VAEIIYLRRGFSKHRKGTEHATRNTFAASGTAVAVNSRDGQGDQSALQGDGAEEEAEIGFFNIGIDCQQILDGQDKGCADAAFSRSALAASYSERH
jgi:hypothetical protein